MEKTYKLNIKNNDYSDWDFVSTVDNSTIGLNISPKEKKLFHNDIIDESGNLIDSPYKNDKHIHGVLLTSGKTYGRIEITNKHGKLLYKCIPENKSLPYFLVPFEEKHIGFDKNKMDKYVTFNIKEWTDKHPIGTLTNNFGSVDDNENYINYKLSYNKLNDSLSIFNKIVLRRFRENMFDKIPYYYNNKKIEDRRSHDIITIDPANCTEYDDAIGYVKQYDKIRLSIYISNVPIILEYFDLWKYITDRISCIYFPDKKSPIFPFTLSDNVFSLKEKEDRCAFVLDIDIDPETFCINSVTYGNVIINVNKNFVYDDNTLLNNNHYKQIEKIVNNMNNSMFNKTYKYEILNSHDVVEYCMLLMNHECAKVLYKKKTGIFRSTTKNEKMLINENDKCPELKFLLENISGIYCSHNNVQPHYVIGNGIECYTHITSPIRRIVDCVVMMIIQEDQFEWGDSAKEFMNKWNTEYMINEINERTKQIKKIENEAILIKTYEGFKKVQDNIYFGIVFNKLPIDYKGKKMFKYSVYIKRIKYLSNILSDKELIDYSIHDFSIHRFLDEAKMYKKIRLQLLN